MPIIASATKCPRRAPAANSMAKNTGRKTSDVPKSGFFQHEPHRNERDNQRRQQPDESLARIAIRQIAGQRQDERKLREFRRLKSGACYANPAMGTVDRSEEVDRHQQRQGNRRKPNSSIGPPRGSLARRPPPLPQSPARTR